MKIRWAIVGVIAATVGCSSMQKHHEKEDEEGDEVKMSLAETPAAVQATLKEQAGGGAIDKVDKETKDGKVVYETDIKSGGKEWEIRVAEDGKLISKKAEDADEEKEEKDEKK